MNVETLQVGPIQTNCYIVEDAGETIVIDPGDDLAAIVAGLKGRPVKEVVATHFHWDHVGALSGLAKKTAATVSMSSADADLVDGTASMNGHDLDRGNGAPHVDRRLADGDEVRVGSASLTVIETPGHSRGSICLYCKEHGILFSGDTLFSGGRYGRTDFEGGSMQDMQDTLETCFLGIPDDVVVLPGHEGSSTMGRERALNPYLK